jgi:hypothetical protein
MGKLGDIAPKYAPPASVTSPRQKALPHCAHDTKLHRLQIQKMYTKLGSYGQQKTTLPGQLKSGLETEKDATFLEARIIISLCKSASKHSTTGSSDHE